MATFKRFGNMTPTPLMKKHPYYKAVDPFKIAGNTYFVGTAMCSTHLIDTGNGLIIIDVPPASDLVYVINSIWKAGFNPRDIKYIIISHAHGDHYGSVNTMKHLTGAQIMLSEIDAKDMADHPQYFAEHITHFGREDENFVPDLTLRDGEIFELGNTKIRCVWIPGHTIGTMAHFWDVVEDGKTYHVGIYGGAGFITLCDEMIAAAGLTPEIRNTFVMSIDKVFDEPVDIMLGNHPFHNDTFKKRSRMLAGDKNTFVDPNEWRRFLTELKDTFAVFRKMNQEEIKEAFNESAFEEYTGQYLEFK